MTSVTTAAALAEIGLSPIEELPGHDDPDTDRRAALAHLLAARRLRDQGSRLPVEVEVLFVIGAGAPELRDPPDVSLVTDATSTREAVSAPVGGYPVAWIRGFGVALDGEPISYVQLSYPHIHHGEKIGHLGYVNKPLRYVTPLQVDVALARRHDEARHALGRSGGPLEGLVGPSGKLVGEVDDDRFDAATVELWDRHRAGEWVGQTSSILFFIHVGAQVCGRGERDLQPALRRLEQKRLASPHGLTLTPWLPPLEDDRPSSLADSFELADGTVEVYLPSEGRERSAWRIVVTDGAGAVAHEELVGLMHRPVFGPDVTDVRQLEARLEELLGDAYPKGRDLQGR